MIFPYSFLRYGEKASVKGCTNRRQNLKNTWLFDCGCELCAKCHESHVTTCKASKDCDCEAVIDLIKKEQRDLTLELCRELGWDKQQPYRSAVKQG